MQMTILRATNQKAGPVTSFIEKNSVNKHTCSPKDTREALNRSESFSGLPTRSRSKSKAEIDEWPIYLIPDHSSNASPKQLNHRFRPLQTFQAKGLRMRISF